MPDVHPTAILEGDITLADDVVIGPHCVLTGPIDIGAGTRLIGHVHLHGPLHMGCRNLIYPFTCLGFAPQHARFDPRTPGLGSRIGDDNVFREHSTVHRAFQDQQPTTIGNRNYFMASSHAGHDCQIGDDNTFVQSISLGGHVTVEHRVTIGGGTVVHQWVKIGEGAMLSGAMATSLNIPPWFMLTGINICGTVNLIGMRRAGMTSAQISTVRWVFGVLVRGNQTMARRVQQLRERADDPLVARYLQFLEGSKRPIASGSGRAIRGTSVERSNDSDDQADES